MVQPLGFSTPGYSGGLNEEHLLNPPLIPET